MGIVHSWKNRYKLFSTDRTKLKKAQV